MAIHKIAQDHVGVAALLAGWTLVGVPFLLFGVAALVGSVGALLAGWTFVGVRSCCSESRRCWAVSRSCTVLNCRGGWLRG